MLQSRKSGQHSATKPDRLILAAGDNRLRLWHTAPMKKRKMLRVPSDPGRLTKADLQGIHDAADVALKEVLGDLYDPSWRDRPPAPSPIPSDFDYEEYRRTTSIAFFDTAYRLQKSIKPTRHRLGGRRAIDPKCAICRTPLVLFADFDATDPRLEGAHSLRRLPLYYCCSCPGPVYYRVLDNGGVKVVPAKAEPYDECPFTNPPRLLPSGYLQLCPVPTEVEAAIIAARKDNGFESLSASQLRDIAKVLGRKPRGRWSLYFSQLGGYPRSFQGGDEGKPPSCPNLSCPNRRRRRQEFKYRPLAVLDLWERRFWGPRKAMLDALQIVFHICPGCHCIAAKYTCT